MEAIVSLEANPISRRSHQARVNYKLPSKLESAREKNCPYYTDISKAGKLRNIISGVQGEAKNEVHTFHLELLQKIHSENFNATEMAENAPDRLKAWAETSGFELEDVLNQWEDRATATNENYTAEGQCSFLSKTTTEGSTEMQTLSQEIRQSIREGTFNAAEFVKKAPAELKTWAEEIRGAIQEGTFNPAKLAEEAPAELKAWAEKYGIKLSVILNQLAEKATEIDEKISSTTENKNEEWLTDSLLEQILTDYFTLGPETTILGMSEDDTSEMQTFSQEIRQSIREGTFDVAEFVKKAPAELKTWAEEIRGAIQDGTFNHTELAKEAPAELKAWAEKYSIDLFVILNQLAEKATEIDENLSSTTENNDEKWAMDSLLEQILTDYFTLEPGTTILDMRADDTSELQKLVQEIRQAIQDGTLNAAEFIEKISIALKTWADENSISLDEALNQWANKVAEMEEPFTPESPDEA